jgi:hypothetical protein
MSSSSRAENVESRKSIFVRFRTALSACEHRSPPLTLSPRTRTVAAAMNQAATGSVSWRFQIGHPRANAVPQKYPRSTLMAKRTLVPLLTFVVLGTLVHAAPADSIASFLGKWKLDPAHSRLTDQMKVEAAGLNKFNMNFSGDNVETIVADGTDQPGLFGTTLAVIVQDANNWKVVRKKDGRTTIIGLWQLSPDGKTLTDNFTGYRDNGTSSNLHYIYQRIAGPATGAKTSGFVGTWESTTEDVNSTYEIDVQPFQDDGLSFINAGGQLVQNLHFDGKEYPGSGTGAPQGYTSSGHRINDHAIERVDKVNGKTLYTQQIEVSPDGKTLTMTVHAPGRDKPDIMVFNRE